jgi:hypothetical protein
LIINITSLLRAAALPDPQTEDRIMKIDGKPVAGMVIADIRALLTTLKRDCLLSVIPAGACPAAGGLGAADVGTHAEALLPGKGGSLRR